MSIKPGQGPAIKRRNINLEKCNWGNISTLDNYVDVDELYDIDETEELYLQAVRKIDWKYTHPPDKEVVE